MKTQIFSSTDSENDIDFFSDVKWYIFASEFV